MGSGQYAVSTLTARFQQQAVRRRGRGRDTAPRMSMLRAAPRFSPRATWVDRWGGDRSRSSSPSSSSGSASAGCCRSCRSTSRSRASTSATLGLVIAAWPAARLISEPIFGWLADRTARVPLMVIGLVATGVFGALPLVWTGPLAFLVLRAGRRGLGAAIYDPAARGFLTDATPPDRRGEAFGLYGAAQMGGLLLGPTIGALGAARFGGIAFVFVFSAIAAIVAAVAIAMRVREEGPAHKADASPWSDRTTMPPDSPYVEGRAAAALAATDRRGRSRSRPSPRPPMRLLNRGLIAAHHPQRRGLLRRRHLRGDLEPLPAGARRGPRADRSDLRDVRLARAGAVAVCGAPRRSARVVRVHRARMVLPAVTGVLYTLMWDPALAVPLILVEATGFAFLNPALYSVVAANSPPGRSSTAQGLFGAAGTLGLHRRVGHDRLPGRAEHLLARSTRSAA